MAQDMGGEDVTGFWDAFGLSGPVPLATGKSACELALKMRQGDVIPFLISVTAQGKSAMVGALARKHEYRLVRMSMVGMEPTDLTGLPFFAPDAKTFTYVPDGRLPVDEDPEKVILFLDEVNRTEPHTVNALFQLLDGWLGSRRLGPNVRVILAANPSDSTYSVASQVTSDPALLRRCTVLPIARSEEELLSFARDPSAHGSDEPAWHPRVLSFLSNNLSLVHELNKEGSGALFATAAGWERISRLTYAFEAGDGDTRGIAAYDAAVRGSIGGETAAKWMVHYHSAEVTLTVEDMLYKVTAEGEQREVLIQLTQEGQDIQIGGVLKEVATYIATHKPAPEKIAPSLAWVHILVNRHTWNSFIEEFRIMTQDPVYKSAGLTPRYFSTVQRAIFEQPHLVRHVENNKEEVKGTLSEMNAHM